MEKQCSRQFLLGGIYLAPHKTFKDSLPTALLQAFVRLCEECHDRPAHSKEHTKESHDDGQTLEDLPFETAKIPCVNENPIVQKNRDPPTPTSNRYKKGTCRHDIKGNKELDGKKCTFTHPKRCFKICRFGLGGGGGEWVASSIKMQIFPSHFVQIIIKGKKV